MRNGINKLKKMRFWLVLTVVFGWFLFANSNGSTADDLNDPELVKKVLEFVKEDQHGQEVVVNTASEQVFDLLRQISDELKKDKSKLFEISKAFSDLCGLLGKIEEPKRHHIRAIREIMGTLDLLVSEKNKNIADSDEALISKIKTLIILLESLLQNENLNLGGFDDLLLDMLYHRPTEFISDNKVYLSFLALVVTVAGGYWKLKDENDIWGAFSNVLNVFPKQEKDKITDKIRVNKKIKNEIASSAGSRVRGQKIGGHVLRARPKIGRIVRYGEEVGKETIVGGHKLRYRESLGKAT